MVPCRQDSLHLPRNIPQMVCWGAFLSEVIRLCLQPHAGDHHHVVATIGNSIAFFYETIGDHQRGSPGHHECADLGESHPCPFCSDTGGRLSCHASDCQCHRGICAGGVGSGQRGTQGNISRKQESITMARRSISDQVLELRRQYFQNLLRHNLLGALSVPCPA